MVREPGAATQVAPQDNQLVSERGILRLKPDLRLEQRGQHGQDKPNEPDHRGNLADSSLNKPEFGFRYTQVVVGRLVLDPSPCAARRSADVGAPHSPPQACAST